VPFMTAGFLVLCLAVLFLRRERLPATLSAIWQDAWSAKCVGGGIGGFILSRGVRFGVMRGLVSNEAGCGTAPMAHAAAETNSPATQGIFGVFEVFVDTMLLCTVTALAILVSDSGPNACGADAVRTAEAAFSSVLGAWAGRFFSLSILLFGAATVICWSHYGMTCVRYLFPHGGTCRGTCRGTCCGRWAERGYTALFAASLVVGSVAAPTLAWQLADAAIAVMTLLNLLVLLLMHREVEEETFLLFPRRTRPGKTAYTEKNPHPKGAHQHDTSSATESV